MCSTYLIARMNGPVLLAGERQVADEHKLECACPFAFAKSPRALEPTLGTPVFPPLKTAEYVYIILAFFQETQQMSLLGYS